MNGSYSIGEVAKLKGTTIKTLRYYDQINLLKPSFINPESGYRYYSYHQLFTLEFILMLKNSGVSLKAIGEALQNEDWFGIIDLCEQQITDAQYKLVQAQEALFKFQNLSERIKCDHINSVNSNVYYRYFPVRSALVSECTYPPMHNIAYEIFTQLYHNVRQYNLTSFYGTGCIVSLNMQDISISYQSAYVEAYSNKYSVPTALTELPAGTYFCITYSEEDKKSQLQKMISLLNILNKTPRLIIESDTFYTSLEYKNPTMELQVLF